MAEIVDNVVPTIDPRASSVTGVFHLPALITGAASGGGIQAAIFNPNNAPGAVAGFRFHTASGWNVMLRTRQHAADLELTDGTGAVRHLWAGTSYTTEGTVTAGSLVVTGERVSLPGLAGLPGKGTLDLTIDSKGNVVPQHSSVRFKEDVAPLQEDFSKVLLLQPVSFQEKDTGARSIGYLAEDVAKQDLQSLMVYDDDGQPLSVQYKLLPVYLAEVLKEQQQVIKTLAARVQALEDRLESARDA